MWVFAERCMLTFTTFSAYPYKQATEELKNALLKLQSIRSDYGVIGLECSICHLYIVNIAISGVKEIITLTQTSKMTQWLIVCDRVGICQSSALGNTSIYLTLQATGQKL